MLYIYVYIYNSEYIYIYKVAKDPMSHESPLGDSKMQSSVKFHFQHTINHSRQSSTDRVLKIQQDQAKFSNKVFLKFAMLTKDVNSPKRQKEVYFVAKQNEK